MDKPQSKRLNMLDGLRGIAIILVLLNHVDSKPILSQLPNFVRPVFETLFSSGPIGVSFLFILSGFLMAYIYPRPTSTLSFLQKRYTRIFPLFVTMTLVMTVMRLRPETAIWFRVLIILFCALSVHILWVYVVQKIDNVKVGRIIFICFMVLQFVAAIWYLIIVRKPPIFFNQEIPPLLREGTITMVNATLTLPFGNYIPMLDGVYWSLVSEVLFYILYPTVCVPYINVLGNYSKKVKIIFFLSLIPFFGALSQLSKHILKFSMLFLPLFTYFALGILLGYLLRNKNRLILRIISKLNYLKSPVIFFVVVILIRLSLVYTSGVINEYVRMLWTLPLFVMMLIILNEETLMSRFFSSRSLVFLGTISYSVYLCHTAIVDGLHLIFYPANLEGNIVFIILSFSLTLIVATCLYYLLERPYFIGRSNKQIYKEGSHSIQFSIVSFSVIAALFLLIFVAYQSNYNFFSYEKAYGVEVITSLKLKKPTTVISLKQNGGVNIKLKSYENNLGIISASLSHISPPGSFSTPPRLVFQIKPVSSKQWSTSYYSIAEIGESKAHPFGFPLIKEAKNKYFDIRISLTDSLSREDIYINITNGVLLRGVNQLDKKQFITNPFKFFNLALNRIENTINNREVHFVFINLLPFLILTAVLGKRLSTPQMRQP